MTAFTNNSYRGNFDMWSWVPRIEFRVNGPIESGSQLYVEYTIPGSAPVKFEPHLFYKGKEVGKLFSDGQEVGRPGCDAEIDNNTTHYVNDSMPQKAKWSRVSCTFYNVIGWDKTGEGPGMFGSPHLLSENPGDYEFKLLWNNRLARSIKFSVGPGTKFDNGVGSANKLGNDRVIVPVQIIGDQDGMWDRMAWKTEAFYGNPLTGFTALP